MTSDNGQFNDHDADYRAPNRTELHPIDAGLGGAAALLALFAITCRRFFVLQMDG